MSEQIDNLAIWNALEQTDQRFTKSVSRPGGFKGTAVDPVYNMKRVTEVIGPVGYAWGWHVLSERLDTFGAGEDAVTIHSMTVRVWFRQADGSISEVDQVGHTTVAQYRRAQNANEKRRFDVDEEYGKKSLTDALSKAMMSLGASSDIWMGRFDGNKYVPPEDWPALGNGNGKAKESAERQTRQPQPPKPRKIDTAGLSPAQAVDAALAAQDESDDPWSLSGTLIERVVPSIVERINAQPWAEVERLTTYYVDRLNLTEHEKAQVRKAYSTRKRAEVPILAAG